MIGMVWENMKTGARKFRNNNGKEFYNKISQLAEPSRGSFIH